MFSCLREKGLGDMTQCAADRDMFNDDPADLDGDHADIEDPQPGDQMHKNKICEATRRLRVRGFTAQGRILFRQ